MQLQNLAVFASGSGTTLQAVIDAISNGELNAEIKLVVSNKESAYALERAKKAGIPIYVIKATISEEIDDELIEVLDNYDINLVVLAGYLKKIGPKVISEHYVINTHPSLLPKFGGKGMYGDNVHKAVIEANEKTSGVTVHYVDNELDTGCIISQATVPVFPTDTYHTLAARVQQAEKPHLVKVLKDFAEGRIIE